MKVTNQDNPKDKSLRINMDHTYCSDKEPVAIVGIGCRFPGGIDSPESFFQALLNGRDCISHVPKDRFDIDFYYDPDPNAAGKVKTRKGGFLEDWDKFDAEFFGYFPSVAKEIDPQQRLMLMASYEAIEDAGITKEELSGSRVAVFAGDFMHDYYSSKTDCAGYRDIGPHSAMGIVPSATAGRVSDRFNFRGPAVSLDTACSSSLVATQLGLQSIWSGTADFALVGGVNVITNPASYVLMSKGNFLSPDGCCKSFDASANGYVRGEACGVAFLMPLREAERRGLDVYAVIKDAYVNHDGFTDKGFTVPNMDSQVEMLQHVYLNAGVDPKDVDYIESHGTGTVLGDPIETGAFGQVFGKGRESTKPLLIGSVKTNIGHTEAGAGIAGLIKIALALKNRKIPKNIHFNTPNPNIKWKEWNLKVVDENRAWPEVCDRPLRGGVNSFGASGTNAHVILEEYIPCHTQDDQLLEESSCVFPMVFNLSAMSESALKDLAVRYIEFIKTSKDSLVDICASVANFRSKMKTQLAIIAQTKDDLLNGLQAYIDGKTIEGLVTGEKPDNALKVAFVCSGQGPQWYAMGRQLMDTSVVFRETMEEIDEIFSLKSGHSVLEEMKQSKETSRISETRVAQPAIMAVQIALIQLLKDFGIEPDGLVGHSIGEVAAAYGAGSLTLEQAVDVIYNRSRGQDQASGAGKMLAVGLPLAKVSLAERVSIAAINGPEMLTLSGDTEPLQDLAERLEKEGVFHKFLRVNVPFHSHHMEPLKEELLADLEHVTPRKAKKALYSTVTGNQEDGTHLVSEYWYKNVRNPVYFTDALKSMILDGYNVFLEISPHPVLGGSISDVVHSMKKNAHIISIARRDIKKFESSVSYEERAFLTGVTKASQLGLNVSWDALFLGKKSTKHIKLPRYAWQLEGFEAGKVSKDVLQKQMRSATSHPIVQKAQLAPGGSSFSAAFFDLDLDRREKRWLNSHVVDGVVVVPGTAHIEAALCAAGMAFGDEFSHLEDLYFDSALILPDEEEKQLDIKLHVVSTEGDYKLFSRLRDENNDSEWTEHSGGRMNFLDHAYQTPPPVDIEKMKRRVDKDVDVPSFYSRIKSTGLTYGRDFRLITNIWTDENKEEVLAKSQLPDHLSHRSGAYKIHPALMDAVWHSVFAAQTCGGNYLPSSMGRVRIFAKPNSILFTHVRKVCDNHQFLIADFTVMNPDGTVVAEIEKLLFKYVEGSRKNSSNMTSVVYLWKESKPTEENNNVSMNGNLGTILAFGDADDVIAQAMGLIEPAVDLLYVTKGDGYVKHSDAEFKVNPTSEEDFDRLISAASEDGTKVQKVVFGWALDYAFDEECSAVSIDSQTTELGDACVNLVKALSKAEYSGEIFFVTNGASSVSSEDTVNFGQGLITGVSRVLVNENRNMRVRAVDLSADKSEIVTLANEVAHYGSQLGQVEVALRGSKRYHHVMRRTDKKEVADQSSMMIDTDDKSFKYDFTQHGSLDSLVFRDHSIENIATKDVVVDVKCTALNFKDVLNAMGVLKYETVKGGLTENRLGFEISGVVTEVGSGVTDFKPGDEVFGRVPYGLASTVATKEYLLQLKPTHLSFPEAAAIPMVFTTAHHGLMDLARMEKGERVLIHSAAGGVGLAAIQLATMIGAEVFATVGSIEKVKYLREMGIKNIYNSRTTDFYSDIMRDTNGEGVDIVLNSLTGKAILQSFKVLRPFGRFVEIGKADVYENSQIGLRRFGENISYHVVDIDRLDALKPFSSARLLKEVTKLFWEKKCSPLPIRAYDVLQTEEALRYLGRGVHIGKVVICMKGKLHVLPAKTLSVPTSATYLITGGASGLGLRYAKFLANRGAKHLVLVSRSGVKTREEQIIVDSLKEMGVEIALPKLDITDEHGVKELVARVKSSMPPIKGVIHSAGLVDDASLQNMTTQRWRKVYLPKVLGAWNLHKATLGVDLDFFLNISSISAFLGIPGQANYSAANNTLDRLNVYRQNKGLPGCSMNAGLLGNYAGMSAESDEKRKYLNILSRQGFETMPLDLVLHRSEQIILEQIDCRIEALVDWTKFGTFFTNLHDDSRFEMLLSEVKQEQIVGEGGNSFKDQVMRIGCKNDQQKFLLKLLLETQAKILGTSTDKIPVDRPMSKIGLDSLMMNQLRYWIQTNLDINFPLMRLTKGPALTELASEVLSLISKEDANDAPAKSLEDHTGIAGNSDIEIFTNGWFLRNKDGPAKPTVRVFMQHSVGASASLFTYFLANPHHEVDFVAIQWPGREHRSAEAPIDDMDIMIEELTEAIKPYVDIPFVLWGHSFGGIVMYELARSLTKIGVSPSLFIDTATIAPHLTKVWQKTAIMETNKIEGISGKDSDYVWDRITSEMYSTDTKTPGHKELLISIFRLMEMDYPLMKSYNYPGGHAVLGCPVTAYASPEDEIVTVAEVGEWRHHTTKEFTLVEVTGDHWFISKPYVKSMIRDNLLKALEENDILDIA